MKRKESFDTRKIGYGRMGWEIWIGTCDVRERDTGDQIRPDFFSFLRFSFSLPWEIARWGGWKRYIILNCALTFITFLCLVVVSSVLVVESLRV